MAAPPPTPRPSLRAQFPLDSVVVGVTSELIALPWCFYAQEAWVKGERLQSLGVYAWALPLAIAGISFHWWKRWVGARVRLWIERDAMRWWPLALIIASAYFLGPDIYQRALIPPPPSSGQAILTLEAQKTTLIDWLKQAQKERDQVIVERNSAQSSWAADLKRLESIQSQAAATQQELDHTRQDRDLTKRQLADTQAQLAGARQPTPATPAAPSPPKKFYSQKQKDELADMLQAAMSLVDNENADILPITNTFMPQMHRMGGQCYT